MHLRQRNLYSVYQRVPQTTSYGVKLTSRLLAASHCPCGHKPLMQQTMWPKPGIRLQRLPSSQVILPIGKAGNRPIDAQHPQHRHPVAPAGKQATAVHGDGEDAGTRRSANQCRMSPQMAPPSDPAPPRWHRQANFQPVSQCLASVGIEFTIKNDDFGVLDRVESDIHKAPFADSPQIRQGCCHAAMRLKPVKSLICRRFLCNLQRLGVATLQIAHRLTTRQRRRPTAGVMPDNIDTLGLPAAGRLNGRPSIVNGKLLQLRLAIGIATGLGTGPALAWVIPQRMAPSRNASDSRVDSDNSTSGSANATR